MCVNRAAPPTSDTAAAHMNKICERTFDSFHGLRQHIRRAHSIICYADAQGKEDSPLPVSNHSSMESRDDPVSIPSVLRVTLKNETLMVPLNLQCWRVRTVKLATATSHVLGATGVYGRPRS